MFVSSKGWFTKEVALEKLKELLVEAEEKEHSFKKDYFKGKKASLVQAIGIVERINEYGRRIEFICVKCGAIRFEPFKCECGGVSQKLF